jgi:tRNA(fMet)-specific endonuclease VapC
MSNVLVDTDVVSFLFKGHSLAELYKEKLETNTLHICLITIGELYLGATMKKWGSARRRALSSHIDKFSVLELDIAVAHAYADVITSVRALGREIHFSDAWIAATALAYEMPLLTHNRRHFTYVKGLEVMSRDEG